jgi:hypothetical protein
MGLKIICSGYLLRYPLGGFCWHHLQYLIGFKRLGHHVTYVEHSGWPLSCYDPSRNDMTSDPTYGLAFVRELFQGAGMGNDWCYVSEDGAAHGMPREQLGQACHESDLYVNLSNINWIEELRLCRRRVLVDTDPVFTQIGGFGEGGQCSQYHTLFTYGENVHRAGCMMPTGGFNWLPTRQPVVRDLWRVTPGNCDAPFTTVMSWSAYGERTHGGIVYGQKDREFTHYFDFPRRTELNLELAVNAPIDVRNRLAQGGWRIVNPLDVSRTPAEYQSYLTRSAGEFSLAKHGYVVTQCGWFSDRTSGYLASGRPAVVQETGFSRNLPTGKGLLAFRTPDEAARALQSVRDDYAAHCAAARALVDEHFDSDRVLSHLLARSI